MLPFDRAVRIYRHKGDSGTHPGEIARASDIDGPVSGYRKAASEGSNSYDVGPPFHRPVRVEGIDRVRACIDGPVGAYGWGRDTHAYVDTRICSVAPLQGPVLVDRIERGILVLHVYGAVRPIQVR